MIDNSLASKLRNCDWTLTLGKRPCSLAVIALFLLRGAAVADTDERERIRLPEPVAAAQTQKDLLLVALTYPTAQQGRDRFRAALPELIQFYRQHTQLKMDVTSAEFSAADRQLKSLVADPLVLGDAGARWRKIPKDHPLYHCYFEFPDGPPLTGAPGRDIVDLEMLEVHGRVAVIFSDLNLTWSWANQEVRYGPNSLRLGANLIVFATAQRIAGFPPPKQR